MKSTKISVTKYSADEAIASAIKFTQYRSANIDAFQLVSTGIHWNTKANMQAVVIAVMNPITQKINLRKVSPGNISR
jgi:hypothetical protein